MRRRSAAHRGGKNREAEVFDEEKGSQTADHQRSRRIERRVQDAADGAPRGVLQQSIRGRNSGYFGHGKGITGLEDKEMLKETAKVCPVFYSANYSYGVALMSRLVEIMTPLLQDAFDMELIETHHNQKQDAPSGTAAMLLNAMDPDDAYDHVYQRKGFVGKRGKEIRFRT